MSALANRYIFIALGNPGDEYDQTRHNAGWLALDTILEKWNDPSIPLVWKQEKKLQSLVARLMFGGHEIIAVKPQTFMNRSGEAARAVLQWYANWNPEQPASRLPQVVVFHDDLDLATGEYKLKLGSGPQIHNGVNSIRQQVQTSEFWYARIGVDSRQGDRRLPGHVYVLQKLPGEEKQAVRRAADLLAEELFYLVLS
jgi:PTH1 family peptidyl-tRNA hydrolase